VLGQVTINGMPSEPPSGRTIAATIGEIDASTDEALLRAGIDAAVTAIVAELRAHTPAAALAAAWANVLGHGMAAGVRLAGPADWTWFVSGSVARGESAPGSDVETMVALGDSVSAEDKAALLSRAADVHALLERCGIAGDANGVLASRPRFCRRVSSWTEGIERWATTPREDRGVVMTGLMADSRGVDRSAAGDLLRRGAVAAAERNYPVRQAMLQDATAVRASVPSRLRLFARSADAVDVKLAAVDPVVKIARWAALSAGSDALSTVTRLDDAAAANTLDGDDASTLRESFEWLLRFRWRTRTAPFLAGQPVTDVVSLSDMAPQERAALRGVAREVNAIGRKLNYLASTSAFH
jgi:CBS domain-containing protein